MLKGKEYGLFFSKDHSDLKNLLESVEKNPEVLEDYRKKARQRIIENYTWEKITGQYINLFKEIIKK